MATTKTQLTPIQQIKFLCPLLEAFGVTKIIAEYAGSGDSGDFERIEFRFDDKMAQVDPQIGNTTETSVLSARLFKHQYVRGLHNPDAILTDECYTSFLDAVFSLLPGGWEIEAGSFGVIEINTATKKVRMVHNERIEDVNTSETEL